MVGANPLRGQTDSGSSSGTVGWAALGFYGGLTGGGLVGLGIVNTIRGFNPDFSPYVQIVLPSAAAGAAVGTILGATNAELLGDVALGSGLGLAIGAGAGLLVSATADSEKRLQLVLAGAGTGVLVGAIAGWIVSSGGSDDSGASGSAIAFKQPIVTIRF